MEQMVVPHGRADSWEGIVHRAGPEDRLLLLEEMHGIAAFLTEHGHRAIGVVYHPGYERYGNYVPTVLPLRYDVFFYLDETRALRPLHDVKVDEKGEVCETFPAGA
jgi:erythromycin esterase-like protein